MECSFCGKSENNCKLLIQGPKPNPSYICQTCVMFCVEIIVGRLMNPEDLHKMVFNELWGSD